MLTENVTLLAELTARARAAGARMVRTEPKGMVGDWFAGSATVVASDDTTITRTGYAKPGDCQGEADDETFPPPMRAETRALKAALKDLLGDEADHQPHHIKRAQQAVREAAEALGLDRDALEPAAHEVGEVDSLNHLTPEKADEVIRWAAALKQGARLAKRPETSHAQQ